MIVLILVLIVIKYKFPPHTYYIICIILIGQLFFVYTKNNTYNSETFEEVIQTSLIDQISPELKCCNKIDTEKLAKLTKVPSIVKNNVNDGIQELIESTKGKEESATLEAQNTKYTNPKVRKDYKHIDYLLEKIKLFDHDIYSAIVPTYKQQELDDMQTEDDNLMTAPVPEPCPT
jgi:hypothetical protein